MAVDTSVESIPAASPDVAADGLLVSVVLLWSANFAAVRYSLERMEPLAHAGLRFALAAAIYAAVVRHRGGRWRIERRDLRAVVLLAFVGVFLNQLTSVYGIREIGAANMAMVMATAPIFAAALVLALGHERPTWWHWAGLGVCFLGAVAVVHGAGASLGGTPLLGAALGLGTALSWGAYAVLARPLMQRYGAAQLSAVVIALGALMLLVPAAPQLAEQDWSAPGAGRWAAFGYSLLLALVLTNALWFVGVRRVGAARATLFLYVQPFAGALFALALLGDHVAPEQWLGGVAILCGVLLARVRRPLPVSA